MNTKITLEFYPYKREGVVNITDKSEVTSSKTIREVDFQGFILLAKHIVESTLR